MKFISITIFGFIFYIFSIDCSAYEPDTHQRLSDIAASASVLVQKSTNTNTSVIEDLDLEEYTNQALLYPDNQNGESVYLDPDHKILFIASPFGNIQYLIKAGAALEDEFPRSIFHFDDPSPGHITPLNINGIKSAHSASEWAVENTLIPVIGQSYSISDAYDYLLDALTSEYEYERSEAFGDLFLSIGHATHLIQDMAQPQHVRNDMHCDSMVCIAGQLYFMNTYGWDVNLYNPSLYESYTYSDADIPDFSNNSPVILPKAESYWATIENKGLAQFTNNNFVSAGTNLELDADGHVLPNADYNLPFATELSILITIDNFYAELGKSVPKDIADYCESLQSVCNVTFISTDIIDLYTGSLEINTRASTYSIFDQDLEINGSQKLFTLNALNYQADWKYLLPRAISYSTGLINYFFRGRVDVQPDPDNPGGYLVINKSAYPVSESSITIYYDAVDGMRHKVPDASWSDVSLTAVNSKSGDRLSIQFDTPIDPAPVNSGEYMLVLEGKLGSEDGVAGKTFKNKKYLYTTTEYGCGITYGCSTVYKFTDDFNFPQLAPLDGHNAWVISLAIYNGNIYTADLFAIFPKPNEPGCPATVATINNIEFLGFPHLCDEPATLIEGIDVNTSYVYVFAPTFYSTTNSNIYIFDHDGIYIDTIQDMPVQSLGGGFSVNDNRMCMSGYADGNINAATILTDINGNIIARWPGDPDLGGGPCALTKDRLYVLAWSLEGEVYLNIYDLDGNQITSINLPDSNTLSSAPIFNVTATNAQIYLAAQCIGSSCAGDTVEIIERIVTYNADGTIATEEFVRGQNVTVPWHYNPFWGFDLTPDKMDVLGTKSN